jgi:hypothetical protein
MMLGFRKSLTRPLEIRIVRCIDLPVCDSDTGKCDPYVHISTITPFRNDERWMMTTQVKPETLNPVFDESFVVPGVTGHQKVTPQAISSSLLSIIHLQPIFPVQIVLTVVDQDALRDQVVGEAVLDLSTKNMWRTGGKFILQLKPAEYPVHRKGIKLELDYTSIAPAGMIEVHVTPMTSISNYCGMVYGPK